MRCGLTGEEYYHQSRLVIALPPNELVGKPLKQRWFGAEHSSNTERTAKGHLESLEETCTVTQGIQCWKSFGDDDDLCIFLNVILSAMIGSQRQLAPEYWVPNQAEQIQL